MALSFEEKLRNYAELAVRVGAGLQPGQRLLLRAPVDCADLARRMTVEAYKAGARLVELLWVDEIAGLARFQHAPRDSFDEVPTAVADALNKGSERGDAVLSIAAADPDLLKDQDSGLVAQVQKNLQQVLQPFSRRIVSKTINWCIVAAPIPAWARKVFPDAPGDEAAQARLWDAIFAVCRADLPDPVAAWREHLEHLAARRRVLDAKQYRALRFTGPGTELTVGMPDRHQWLGGLSHSASGVAFVANMPTEEVFCLPHRERVDGVVAASKPLSHAGKLVEDFTLRFQAGRAVEVKAAKNQAVLERLLETDEGATRLGEVALVPHGSPISASGLLFYSTLFDENAASHLALGKAYRPCLAGGTEMADEAFKAAGGNDSLTHVDFMIGSERMDVDGVLADGKAEPVMRAGEWAS